MTNVLYELWLDWFGFWGTALYLVVAVVAYYAIYATAVEFNFRLDVPFKENASIWQDLISNVKGVLKLLALDFLKIHCPWSKKTSVQYRVQEAHRLLQNMTHEKGWKAEDCHDPAKHRQIAKDCFRSRTRFWAEEFLKMLTAPLRILLLFVVAVVVTIMYPIEGIVLAIKDRLRS